MQIVKLIDRFRYKEKIHTVRDSKVIVNEGKKRTRLASITE